MFLVMILFLLWLGKKESAERNETNSFFFPSGITKQEYQGYFVPLSCNEISQNIELNIIELATLEEGTLFALELNQLQPTEDPMDIISMGRQYLGYFYVTENIIYHKNVRNFDGFTDEMNEEVIRLIQEDENFFTASDIVCCEEATPDIVDENGYHSYIEALGDQRIFRYYNDYMDGSKTYMTMVWEKEKGLVYYKCGSGDMFMHVEFGIDLSMRKDY